ncbi:MAG: hypothetical protein GX589_07025 [Deltaproteobacteria bacterium]|nr:hypothetical protein [Deltaproteobacteria bacterium]
MPKILILALIGLCACGLPLEDTSSYDPYGGYGYGSSYNYYGYSHDNYWEARRRDRQIHNRIEDLENQLEKEKRKIRNQSHVSEQERRRREALEQELTKLRWEQEELRRRIEAQKRKAPKPPPNWGHNKGKGKQPDKNKDKPKKGPKNKPQNAHPPRPPRPPKPSKPAPGKKKQANDVVVVRPGKKNPDKQGKRGGNAAQKAKGDKKRKNRR